MDGCWLVGWLVVDRFGSINTSYSLIQGWLIVCVLLLCLDVNVSPGRMQYAWPVCDRPPVPGCNAPQRILLWLPVWQNVDVTDKCHHANTFPSLRYRRRHQFHRSRKLVPYDLAMLIPSAWIVLVEDTSPDSVHVCASVCCRISPSSKHRFVRNSWKRWRT